MESLFEEYITLKRELERKGGPEAVLENPGSELEQTYEKVLSLENDIINKFGLPLSMKYREIVWDLRSKEDSKQIIDRLSKAAQEWLISSPVLSIELLEEAKKDDLKTYEVLPEIGIDDDSLHTIFYFEEYFKKGKISGQELIKILKSIDEQTAVKIGHLNYYIINETNLPESEIIFTELFEKNIPYLEELKNYRPLYPY